jgi:hypothetical protein
MKTAINSEYIGHWILIDKFRSYSNSNNIRNFLPDELLNELNWSIEHFIKVNSNAIDYHQEQ